MTKVFNIIMIMIKLSKYRYEAILNAIFRKKLDGMITTRLSFTFFANRWYDPLDLLLSEQC